MEKPSEYSYNDGHKPRGICNMEYFYFLQLNEPNLVFWDIGGNITTLQSYTEEYFDSYYNRTLLATTDTPNRDILKLIKEVYVPMGATNADHLAWAKGISNVRDFPYRQLFRLLPDFFSLLLIAKTSNTT